MSNEHRKTRMEAFLP